YALSLRAKSSSFRTGGPNGSAPVLMFHGPNEKRYWVGEAPLAMDDDTPRIKCTGGRKSGGTPFARSGGMRYPHYVSEQVGDLLEVFPVKPAGGERVG